MSEPIRIPLSDFQRARFRALEADIARATQRKDDTLTAIVGGVVDPSTILTWDIGFSATEIVLTPPEEAKE